MTASSQAAGAKGALSGRRQNPADGGLTGTMEGRLQARGRERWGDGQPGHGAAQLASLQPPSLDWFSRWVTVLAAFVWAVEGIRIKERGAKGISKMTT